ncbi:hypothetical protein BDZ89DRAFT_1107502 [Hymenopellis radicata]|nr:hypothetical protein BDZ89DRAFT_1107502 [Hymenopellis radicata]
MAKKTFSRFGGLVIQVGSAPPSLSLWAQSRPTSHTVYRGSSQITRWWLESASVEGSALYVPPPRAAVLYAKLELSKFTVQGWTRNLQRNKTKSEFPVEESELNRAPTKFIAMLIQKRAKGVEIGTGLHPSDEEEEEMRQRDPVGYRHLKTTRRKWEEVKAKKGMDTIASEAELEDVPISTTTTTFPSCTAPYLEESGTVMERSRIDGWRLVFQ